MGSVEDTFKALSVARRLRPGEPCYVLDLALPFVCGSGGTDQSSELLAVCCSGHSVRLHSRETLRVCGEYRGHEGPVLGARFAPPCPTLLFTGSADGTLCSWDVRRPGSAAVRVFRSDPEHSYCCFDVSCSGGVLCAGTEQAGEDSFLVFWDARMAGSAHQAGGERERLLGVYSESHSDDITAVRFHPTQPDRLASGGTDGLVNVFDLSLGTEDDALITTCNCGSSTAALCWSGKNLEQLLSLSHDEGLCLWDLAQLDTDDTFTLLTSPDARTLVPLPEGTSLDYFVGGTWLEEAGCLLLLGGANTGELHLLDCKGSGLRLIKSLKGGHGATVRCFQWDASAGALLTGGEDGELLQWKAGANEISVGKRDALKSISSMQLKTKAHRKLANKKDKKETL